MVSPAFRSCFPRMRIQSCLFVAMLLFLPLNTGCNRDKDGVKTSEPAPVTAELARTITHATSGIILTTDPIRVRFAEQHVRLDRVNQPIVTPEPIFRFTPWINGQSTWSDDGQTLTYTPDEPLPRDTAFLGVVDLDMLFHATPDKPELGSFEFSFKTGSQEISQVSGEFGPHPTGAPDRAVFTGTIVLTEPAELNQVKSATRITLDGRTVTPVWSIREDQRMFSYVLEDLVRDNRTHDVEVIVDGEPLGAADGAGHRRQLHPARQLLVSSIYPETEGSSRLIHVELSDTLDPAQDLNGFLRIEPAISFSLRKSGRRITLVGDFSAGASYRVFLSKGIRSIWGNALEAPEEKQIQFSHLKPAIRFLSDGMVLSSGNRQQLRFESVNVKSVNVEIQRIYEANLGQYLQWANLGNTAGRNDSFTEADRVAVKVAETSLDLEMVVNRKQVYDLDLSGLMPHKEAGLFLVKMWFDKDNMVYNSSEPQGSYYDDPRRNGYLWRHGSVYKAVLVSDLGVSATLAGHDAAVTVTRISNAEPVAGATVNLKNYQNHVMQSRETDADGLARFTEAPDEIYFVEAVKDRQVSVVIPKKMSWNTGSFDVGGANINQPGIRAYIYPDRGVHRPGDTIHLSVILRNPDHSFPDHHPVTLKLTNPRRQEVLEQSAVAEKDGFVTFSFATEEDAPTGTWQATVTAGDSTFVHALPVETVVPYRLKLELGSSQDQIGPDDTEWVCDLHADYLFGNPAPGLTARAEVRLTRTRPPVSTFKEYTFDNETIRFKEQVESVYNGKLDENGDATIKWKIPSLKNAPTTLSARLTATVLEKGGRPNRTDTTVPVHPFRRYVGLERPDFKWGYAGVGEEMVTRIIVVGTDGKPVSGQQLNWTLYHNERSWWWEYRSWSDYKRKYRDDLRTTEIATGSLRSEGVPVPLKLTPEKRGSYLLEVQNGDGHTAAFFFNAYSWGEATAPDNAATIAMEMDRQSYNPGDTAELTFPTPETGSILVHVVKGHSILSAFRVNPSGSERTAVRIPVTAEMIPNCYVTISVLQPHDVTANDRPLRMFGVLNVPVSDSKTQLPVKLRMPDELESGKPFTMTIQAGSDGNARFTVAVVDEGLLALTRFQTPDPWEFFFAKQRLMASLADLYSQVIRAVKGDPYRVFTIGGDAAMMARAAGEKPKEDGKRKRFKPVALFKGPVSTDENGTAVVSFTMPEYIGAVRAMVVAADGNRYGHAEKSVPVKQDLMLMPTLPRVLHPGDQLKIPVTVFSMKDGIGTIKLSVKTEGPVDVGDNWQNTITLEKAGERDILIPITVKQALGQVKIQLQATAESVETTHSTDLTIVPVSPELTEWKSQPVKPGERINVKIPGHGIPGSNRVQLQVSKRAGLNLQHRLDRLIRYPYGCVEQTTSAAMPQLYLKHLSRLTQEQESRIDQFINAAIDKLRRFQTADGGFSYWAGGATANTWCSSYVGRFLLEAHRAGYHVPAGMQRRWLQYEQQAAARGVGTIKERCFRVYLLARAGQPATGAMNLLKENSLGAMTATDRHLLAAAYYLGGSRDIAAELKRGGSFEIAAYRESGGTYGSAFRDRSILLELTTEQEDWEHATELFARIAQRLSSKEWLSTQETGYALSALGNYIARTDPGNEKITGSIQLPDGTRVPFDTPNLMIHVDVPEGSGETAEINLSPDCPIETVQVTTQWTGIPRQADAVSETHAGIRTSVRWLDEDGHEIDPSRMPQGTTFYAHYRVRLDSAVGSLDEVVLEQMVPTGWEIDNLRLDGGGLPAWTPVTSTSRVEYTDIRDDRVSWFFDLYSGRHQEISLLLKLRAVTRGRSQLPPTVCTAMYDNRYSSVIPGRSVEVQAP